MKKQLLILILSTLLSENAFSDEIKTNADSFKGLSLGIGLSDVKFNSDYSDTGGSLDDNRFDATNIVPRFDGSYMFKLNDSWLLGVGLSVDLKGYNGNKHSIAYSYSVPGEIHIRNKNHFSLYLEPAYAISDSIAVFGKLSYHSSNIRDVWNCSGCISDHRRLDGVGLGLGLKKMIDENLYIQFEGEYVKYTNDKFSLSGYYPWAYHNNYSYAATASIGYHF